MYHFTMKIKKKRKKKEEALIINETTTDTQRSVKRETLGVQLS